ncbi:MAG: FAD-dependent oxidoreductase [Ferrimicrobium sp.]
MSRITIVGGGILGTMHAWFALQQGWEVLQLERDNAPRSASVRSLGLIWVSARREGSELAMALRSRFLWQQIAESIPNFPLRFQGSLTVATSQEELEVVSRVAGRADAIERGFALLSPSEILTRFPDVRGLSLGGLWCEFDAVVEPRLVLSVLQRALERNPQYLIRYGRGAVELAGTRVRDQLGTWYDADRVVVCTGATTNQLAGELLADAPLRKVRLQMAETTPLDRKVGVLITDGDSLRYYPAFVNEANELLLPQKSEWADWNAHLLLGQRINGSLTIGDTHSYVEPFDFDVSEPPYDYLRARAEQILGYAIPPMTRRWGGVYVESTEPGGIYVRRVLDAGVEIVTGAGGKGMTLAPAIAEDTILAWR